MLRGLLWLSVAALAQGHASQARFGIYDLQGAAPTADWVLANADHLRWHGGDLARQYNTEKGIAVIKPFLSDNCCIALEGGLKLQISNTQYLFQFPANSDSGVLNCVPKAGHHENELVGFYKLPLVDVVTHQFSAAAGCKTAHNPALWVKLTPVIHVAPSTNTEFGLYDAETSPGGDWVLMDSAMVNLHRASFLASYNADGGLAVIKNFKSVNCCLAVKGGYKLSLQGASISVVFLAAPTATASSIACNPAAGYMGRYKFLNTPQLAANAVFEDKEMCTTSHNPGVYMRHVAHNAPVIEFGLHDLEVHPSGNWQLMSAGDVEKHKQAFVEQYNEHGGVAVIATFRSGNCCVALQDNLKLTISGTKFNIQFLATTPKNSMRCNPTKGYKNSKYMFYTLPTLLATQTFGGKRACEQGEIGQKGHNPALYMRVLSEPTGAPTAAPTKQPTVPPPVHCHVSAWADWAECSKTCGVGVASRERTVVSADAHGGDECPQLYETKMCLTEDCPVHCEVSEWGEWAQCNAECGGGTSVRYRAVTKPPSTAGSRCPHLTDTHACNTDPCPIHCKWSEWGEWTACNAECGGGAKSRWREVIVDAVFGGDPCPGTSRISQPCNTDPCAVHCEVSPWGDWGGCTGSCGGGGRHRFRLVALPSAFGGTGCPHLEETSACNTHGCPIDCHVTFWSPWTVCSKTCGIGAEAGSKVRRRNIAYEASFGGASCPPLAVTAPCNEHGCPVHCIISSWTKYRCSKTCVEQGGDPDSMGQRLWARKIVQHGAFGGKPCNWNGVPVLAEHRKCALVHCPIDCVMTAWGVWGTCSISCGEGGLQSREITATRKAQYHGRPCPSTRNWVQQRECEDLPVGAGGARSRCPVDCAVSDFGEWAVCTRTCSALETQVAAHLRGGSASTSREVAEHMESHGGGWQRRQRSPTVSTEHGGKACPMLNELRECANATCSVDCVVSDWAPWTAPGGGLDSSCSKSCGGGVKERVRRVVTPHFGSTGVDCPALTELGACNAEPCPVDCAVQWTIWDACSQSCGSGGSHSRTHTVVVHPVFGGKACPSETQQRACMHFDCDFAVRVHRFHARHMSPPTAHPTASPTPSSKEEQLADLEDEAGIEFGIFDFSLSPGGGWQVMAADDFRTYHDRFIEAYNTVMGVKLIRAFKGGNCCFAVAGGKKLTVSDTQYTYQFPASIHGGGIRCTPALGYDEPLYQFYKSPALKNSATFGAETACATDHNPAVFMRVKTPANAPVSTVHFGMYDYDTVPAGGWQVMAVADMNEYSAELAQAYNSNKGFDLIKAWTAGNCCFAVKGGDKLHIAGTKHGYQFPAHAETRTIQCSPEGGYNDFKYVLYKLPILTAKAGYSAKPGCATNHNPALFMKLPTAPTKRMTFGMYDYTSSPAGGWSLMSEADFTQYGGDFIDYYNINGGVSIIGEFQSGNCCVAVKGGNKLYIPQTKYGYAFPADYLSGAARCKPSGGYTDTKYKFYKVPEMGEDYTFTAKAGCATKKNPGVFMKEIDFGTGEAIEFGMHDHTVSPPGGWEIMDIGMFHDHRVKFMQHYNANKGFNVIRNFKSGNCCFVMKGGGALMISGTKYEYQFPALDSTGGIRCNPSDGYGLAASGAKYQFYQTPTLSVDNIISSEFACTVNHNPGIFIRNHRTALTHSPTEAPTAAPTAAAVHCTVSEWNGWCPCSAKCGPGAQTRKRTVVRRDAHGGDECPTLEAERPCNLQDCPIHCNVGEWGEWGPCNAVCGGGSSTRRREVLTPPEHSGAACPHLTQALPCHTQPCPVGAHCLVTEWSGYSPCNAECGGGETVKTRMVTVTPAYRGDECPPLEFPLPCNTQPCPVHCQVGHWGGYGDCNAVCGGGYSTRERAVVVQARFNGEPCPHLAETRQCSAEPCPVHCQTSAWGEWGACTASCGTGSAVRTRTVAVAAKFRGNNCGRLTDGMACNPQHCPGDTGHHGQGGEHEHGHLDVTDYSVAKAEMLQRTPADFQPMVDKISPSPTGAWKGQYKPSQTLTCCQLKCAIDYQQAADPRAREDCAMGCALWLRTSSLNTDSTYWHPKLRSKCRSDCSAARLWRALENASVYKANHSLGNNAAPEGRHSAFSFWTQNRLGETATGAAPEQADMGLQPADEGVCRAGCDRFFACMGWQDHPKRHDGTHDVSGDLHNSLFGYTDPPTPAPTPVKHHSGVGDDWTSDDGGMSWYRWLKDHVKPVVETVESGVVAVANYTAKATVAMQSDHDGRETVAGAP
jgi:hypothetical protein